MPRDIVTTVYEYDELTDKAKAKARDWYRDLQNEDQDFADVCIEDFTQVGEILGVDFGTHPVRLMNGTDRPAPSIWWSLHAQGCGANFDGFLTVKLDAPEKIRDYAPVDETLHRIADDLVRVSQSVTAPPLTAKIDASHRETYPEATEITVYDGLDEDLTGTAPADELTEILHRFMRWMHKQLEGEWDSRQEDEYLEDQIRANEYTFTADGKREGE